MFARTWGIWRNSTLCWLFGDMLFSWAWGYSYDCVRFGFKDQLYLLSSLRIKTEQKGGNYLLVGTRAKLCFAVLGFVVFSRCTVPYVVESFLQFSVQQLYSLWLEVFTCCASPPRFYTSVWMCVCCRCSAAVFFSEGDLTVAHSFCLPISLRSEGKLSRLFFCFAPLGGKLRTERLSFHTVHCKCVTSREIIFCR